VADRNLRLRVHRAGLRDELIPHASREQQLAAHGLDKAGIVKRLKQILGIGTQVIPFTRTA
jgi:deoxyxylulose-5-phosphate synthase